MSWAFLVTYGGVVIMLMVIAKKKKAQREADGRKKLTFIVSVVKG